MRISQEDLRKIAVLAGQGEVGEMTSLVNRYAEKERATTGWILLECKDDFHQTAAHIAAKAGQTASIRALAELLNDDDSRMVYFNHPNRFSGDRAVHTAMRHGFLATFKELVAHGADPTLKNRFGDTVLDYAGEYEMVEVQLIMDEYKTRTAKGYKGGSKK